MARQLLRVCTRVQFPASTLIFSQPLVPLVLGDLTSEGTHINVFIHTENTDTEIKIK